MNFESGKMSFDDSMVSTVCYQADSSSILPLPHSICAVLVSWEIGEVSLGSFSSFSLVFVWKKNFFSKKVTS
jgi:hypothetical protein